MTRVISCYIPGIALNTRDIAVNKTDPPQKKILVFFEHMHQKVRYIVFGGGEMLWRNIEQRRGLTNVRGWD